MRKWMVGLIALGAAITMRGMAHGAIQDYTFTGTVTDAGGWAQTQEGAAVTGEWQFDDAASAYATNANQTHYAATTLASLTLGGQTYATTRPWDLGIHNTGMSFDDAPTDQGTNLFFSENGAQFADQGIQNVDGLDGRSTQKTWAMVLYDRAERSWTTVKGIATTIAHKYVQAYPALFGKKPASGGSGPDLAFNPFGGNDSGCR